MKLISGHSATLGDEVSGEGVADLAVLAGLGRTSPQPAGLTSETRWTFFRVVFEVFALQRTVSTH